MSGTGPKMTSRLLSNTASDSPRDSATSGSGSRAQGNDEAYEGTRDAFILGFNIVKDISEATGVLSPLKSVCALIIRGLETTRVSTRILLTPLILLDHELSPTKGN
jgi:hypothetical protein